MMKEPRIFQWAKDTLSNKWAGKVGQSHAGKKKKETVPLYTIHTN